MRLLTTLVEGTSELLDMELEFDEHELKELTIEIGWHVKLGIELGRQDTLGMVLDME